MALDPLTILTLATALLGVTGIWLVQASRPSAAGAGCVAMRWWGIGFLTAALGFALVLAAPHSMRAPPRVAGNALLMLAYGIYWAAARHFGGRPFRPELVGAGVLVWLIVAVGLDPEQHARVATASLVATAYSAAAAREFLWPAAPRVQMQVWAAAAMGLHGLYFLPRAVLGPAFGLGAWGQSMAQGWGAALGIETMLFTVVFGFVATAMSRDRAADGHRRDALEDPLTGVGNRRALFGSGEALLGACGREGRPAALLLMDLDHFKRVNDRHGHAGGDRLLVAFARLAHDYLPPAALVCRFGGEEFVAVLPGADADRARAVARELGQLFAHLAIEGEARPIRTTVSVGIVQAGPGASLADLLARADACLYAAKAAGRDRAVHEDDLGERRAAA